MTHAADRLRRVCGSGHYAQDRQGIRARITPLLDTEARVRSFRDVCGRDLPHPVDDRASESAH